MSDESPLDQFKRALTGTARALAHEPEVEVAWSADSPSSQGKNFRVPLPGRNVPREQAAEARGFADSFALKLRHHNETLHAKRAPSEPVARACYDAVEQVRYEALGANNFSGMRGNLEAANELRTSTWDRDLEVHHWYPTYLVDGAHEVRLQYLPGFGSGLFVIQET